MGVLSPFTEHKTARFAVAVGVCSVMVKEGLVYLAVAGAFVPPMVQLVVPAVPEYPVTRRTLIDFTADAAVDPVKETVSVIALA